MNILAVTAWPPKVQAGGVGTMVRTLAAELSPQHRVTVLVNDWDSRRLRRTQDRQMASYCLRLRLPYLPTTSMKSILGWLRDLPTILIDLRRLVQAEQIDIIHLHFASAYQFYFRLLQAFSGPPYIITLHRGDTVNFAKWSKFEQMLTLWTLRGSRRVIAVSKWLADLAERTFPGVREIDCIHNGMKFSDLDDLDQTPPSARSDVELPAEFFLMVANVTYYKAPDVAIKAWAKILLRRPDLHLVIVGEARELWDPCVKLIEDLGCGDRVHMAGSLPRATVLRAMKRATALVFPSRSEGLPLVLLEAGAAGLPTICSNIGPIAEVVEDNHTALLVPQDDPDALAGAVVRMAGDQALRHRLGSAIRERVRSDFSAERMAARYVAAYRGALADESDKQDGTTRPAAAGADSRNLVGDAHGGATDGVSRDDLSAPPSAGRQHRNTRINRAQV